MGGGGGGMRLKWVARLIRGTKRPLKLHTIFYESQMSLKVFRTEI